MVLLYFIAQLVQLIQKTRATFSENQIENQTNQSQLGHSRFPALQAICMFSLATSLFRCNICFVSIGWLRLYVPREWTTPTFVLHVFTYVRHSPVTSYLTSSKEVWVVWGMIHILSHILPSTHLSVRRNFLDEHILLPRMPRTKGRLIEKEVVNNSLSRKLVILGKL